MCLRRAQRERERERERERKRERENMHRGKYTAFEEAMPCPPASVPGKQAEKKIQ